MDKNIFGQYMEMLKVKARQRVTLLKEKNIAISEEAKKLLEAIDEEDTGHLFRKLTR